MSELKATSSVTSIEFSKAQFEIKKPRESDAIVLHVIRYTDTKKSSQGEILSGITDQVFLFAENIKQIKELGESLVQISKQMEEKELKGMEKYAFRIK